MNILSSIIQETPEFYVINKPIGIGMHDETSENGTIQGIISALRAALNDHDIFPCHRLDKVTSGILLVGKGKANTAALSGVFAARKAQKYYLAISAKKPNKKQGSVIGDMCAARNGSWRLAKTKNSPAITQFFSYGTGNLPELKNTLPEGHRFFVLKPYTGKTHQIRVALKSLGAPILGDERYGGASADRTYLHAYQLAFTLNNQEHCLRCLPESGEFFRQNTLEHALNTLGDIHQLAWPKQ